MIRLDLEKCSGCKRCEVACAFFRTGKVSHSLARIKVLNLFEFGIDGPVVCVQCKERYCMRCPESALTIGELGQVIVSPTACTLCKACENLCPIGAIEIFDGLVYVCDLCGGDPECVKACTEGAILFEPNRHEAVSLAEFKKDTRHMNPGQKRFSYIFRQGQEMRKKWRKKNAEVRVRG